MRYENIQFYLAAVHGLLTFTDIKSNTNYSLAHIFDKVAENLHQLTIFCIE